MTCEVLIFGVGAGVGKFGLCFVTIANCVYLLRVAKWVGWVINGMGV